MVIYLFVEKGGDEGRCCCLAGDFRVARRAAWCGWPGRGLTVVKAVKDSTVCTHAGLFLITASQFSPIHKNIRTLKLCDEKGLGALTRKSLPLLNTGVKTTLLNHSALLVLPKPKPILVF